MLNEYEFEIIYKPGKYNTNADALSRCVNINIISKNDNFENFIEFHYKTLDITHQIEEKNGNLFNFFPNAVYFSTDFVKNFHCENIS